MNDGLAGLLAGVAATGAAALVLAFAVVVAAALLHAAALVALDEARTEALLGGRTLLLGAQQEALDAGAAVALDVNHLAVLLAWDRLARGISAKILLALEADLALGLGAAGLARLQTLERAAVVAALGVAVALGVEPAHVLAASDGPAVVHVLGTVAALGRGADTLGIANRMIDAFGAGTALDVSARLTEVGVDADVGAAVVTAALAARTLGVIDALVLAEAALGAGRDGGTAARLADDFVTHTTAERGAEALLGGLVHVVLLLEEDGLHWGGWQSRRLLLNLLHRSRLRPRLRLRLGFRLRPGLRSWLRSWLWQ